MTERPIGSGPCAKTVVRCTIVSVRGKRYVGENWCANPQSTCPRKLGEDYTKCKTICRQPGHAEEDALRVAGGQARGARAYLEGITYACRSCQEQLYDAGVESIHRGPPPEYEERDSQAELPMRARIIRSIDTLQKNGVAPSALIAELVLRELLKPTAAMVKAGCRTPTVTAGGKKISHPGRRRNYFKSMIGAALKGE